VTKRRARRRTTAVRPPALPASIPTSLGRVKIVRATKEALASDGTPAYGDWEWHTRTIRLWDGLKGWPLRQVLWHEWTHVVLQDAGLADEFPHVILEAVCDAIANAMVLRERGGRGSDDL